MCELIQSGITYITGGMVHEGIEDSMKRTGTEPALAQRATSIQFHYPSGKPEFRLVHLLYLDSLNFILSQLS